MGLATNVAGMNRARCFEAMLHHGIELIFGHPLEIGWHSTESMCFFISDLISESTCDARFALHIGR